MQQGGALREESMDFAGKNEELSYKGKFYKAKKEMNTLQTEKKNYIA